MSEQSAIKRAKTKENIDPEFQSRNHKVLISFQNCSMFPRTLLSENGGNNTSNKQTLSSSRKENVENWGHVPNNILLLIFQFLPRKSMSSCSLVCKNWYKVSQHNSLWYRMDLSTKVLPISILSKFISRGVVVMKMTSVKVLDDSINPICIDPPCCIQLLDLGLSSVPVNILNKILQWTTLLRKLSLEHCSVDTQSLQLISKNKKLDTLNLSMCNGVTGVGLSTIFTNCSCLQSLNVAWTGLNEASLDLLCMNLPVGISRWNLSGCGNNLKDRHLAAIASTCKSLLELDISDGLSVTMTGLMKLRSLPKLTSLGISRCYLLANKSLQGVPSVKYLQAFDILSESGADSLKKKYPGIEINGAHFSTIARPTVGIRRSSIWTVRVRET